MSLSKLKQIHVIIIGSFLCIAAAAGMFFLMIKPQMKAMEDVQTRITNASALGNEAALAQANRELVDAAAKVANVQQTLDVQMRQRMPDLSFEQRDRGMLALWQEQTKVLGPLLNSFARDPNVASVQASFVLPTPPWNPNDPIFDQDLIQIPLGSVVAAGDFRHLMDNIRRWNNCRRLVMVSPPSLQMAGEGLVSQYSVTCYIFPVAKGGAPIAMAGAAGAAGAPGAPAAPPMPTPPPTGGAPAGQP